MLAQMRHCLALVSFGREGVRIVLNHGLRVPANKLVVRSVNILLVVGVVFNDTLTVLVVDWETFHHLVVHKEFVMSRILHRHK